MNLNNLPKGIFKLKSNPEQIKETAAANTNNVPQIESSSNSLLQGQ